MTSARHWPWAWIGRFPGLQYWTPGDNIAIHWRIDIKHAPFQSCNNKNKRFWQCSHNPPDLDWVSWREDALSAPVCSQEIVVVVFHFFKLEHLVPEHQALITQVKKKEKKRTLSTLEQLDYLQTNIFSWKYGKNDQLYMENYLLNAEQWPSCHMWHLKITCIPQLLSGLFRKIAWSWSLPATVGCGPDAPAASIFRAS